MKLSARNQFSGTVSKVAEGAVNGIVTIDINGTPVSATISMNAIRELGLAPGKKAYAVIKATEVMVGRSEHLPLSARNQFPGKVLGVEKGAVKAIAKKALEKKTGARGLRNIMENVMRDIMYEIPSRDDVEKCVITEKSIEDAKPKLVLREAKPASEKPVEEKKNEPA